VKISHNSGPQDELTVRLRRGEIDPAMASILETLFAYDLVA
jgi:hypothetical protein